MPQASLAQLGHQECLVCQDQLVRWGCQDRVDRKGLGEKLGYRESQVKWAPKVQGGQLESKGEMVFLEEMENLEPRDHLGHRVHLVRL